jgi:hypothetical protein
VFDILHVTPMLGITVLQPNKRSCDISWNVLGVMSIHRFFWRQPT